MGVRPRILVQVVAGGGIDAISTTDPRHPREVESGVDIPFAPAQILELGSRRLGPGLAPLAARHSQLAIVNGVLVKAANHRTGMEQIARLRTATTARTPSCLDLIGAHRDGQPLAHAILNASLREATTSRALTSPVDEFFGGKDNVFNLLESLSKDELVDTADAITRQIRSLQRRGSMGSQESAIVDSLGQTAALLRRTTTASPLQSVRWLDGAVETKIDDVLQLSAQLQRALWLAENDMAAVITVFTSHLVWDTHAANTRRQSLFNPVLAKTLDRFLLELDRRSNRHGRLSEQTVVMVSSELGRFPYLNAVLGKDHFPQIPVLFWGRPFIGGTTFGATGRELEALPVSTVTGRQSDTGVRLSLDDVGVSMLRLFGIDPLEYGVAGRHLRFLTEAPG